VFGEIGILKKKTVKYRFLKFFRIFSCHEQNLWKTFAAMKLHTLIIASAATATAFAGQITSAPVSSDNNSYVGVSGLYNEFTGGTEAEGFRLDAGFGLGNGLSLDGRFENAYMSASGFGDIKFNELRALAHYTTQLNDGVSLIAGLGYGDMGFSSGGVDFLATEGLLADIGIQAQSGQYTASLTYTHLFALHASAMSFGPSDSAPPKEDIGLLEASLGYQVNENVSAILSAQTQVLGDTEVEKELSVTAGVRYSF
jgi:hypothetical protein